MAGIGFALIVVIGLVIIFHTDKPPASTGKPGGNNTVPPGSTGSGSGTSHPASDPAGTGTGTGTNANKIKGAYAKTEGTPVYTVSPWGIFGTAGKDEWLGKVTDELQLNPLFWQLDSGHAVLKTSIYLIS